jgi:hypothetical protein
MSINPAITTEWTLSRKIGFRFFCCLFILYTFPFPLSNFPFGAEVNKISEHLLGWFFWLLDQVTNFWHWLIPMVGKYLLGLDTPITIFTNGSGDTTYDYVLLFTQVLLSLIISIVWGVLDRNRKSYNTAYYWLCVLTRYYLAGMMLVYGLIKVFHLQMGYPSLARLLQPYGNSSPMGLVWTYVGQSKAYSAIVGISETICGLLLLFRKTTLLGALLSLIVMGNVVIINFCFDVPVKLFSSVLELMALYLAWPYFKQLNQLFIKHKPAVLEKYVQPVFKRKWVRIGVKVLKILIIADALYYGTIGNIDSMKQYGDLRIKPVLYGIYNSELIVKNNDTIPMLLTDTASWKQLVIDREGFSVVKLMNDSIRRFNFKVDTVAHTAIVFTNQDTVHKSTLHYARDLNNLILTGKIKDDSIFMRFKRFDENSFILMNRGFRWINEFPYNR